MRIDAMKHHPAVPWLAALVAVSMIGGLLKLGETSLAVGLIPSPWDKLAHALTFGTIALSLWLAARQRWLGACVGIAFAIAVYDEWRQLYLPGREADLLDLLANTTGILLAVVLANRLRTALR